MPANDIPNTYAVTQSFFSLRFSIEDDCTAMSPIPLSERPNRVWMLMKELTYAYDFKFAWNRTYFSRASSEVGMDFVGAWNVDQHFQWKPEKQGLMKDIEDRHGVINLISKEHGRKSMSPGEWEREIRKSRVMIGVGNPWWSPSPYHALCLGVPFLNPVSQDVSSPSPILYFPYFRFSNGTRMIHGTKTSGKHSMGPCRNMILR